jgi:hypothetical protein
MCAIDAVPADNKAAARYMRRARHVRAFGVGLAHVPEKHALDLIGGGYRFSGKDMRKQKIRNDDRIETLERWP